MKISKLRSWSMSTFVIIALIAAATILNGCGSQSSDEVSTSSYANGIQSQHIDEAQDTPWRVIRKSECDFLSSGELYTVYEYQYTEDEYDVMEIKALSDKEICNPGDGAHTELTKTHDDRGNVVLEVDREIDDAGTVMKTTETVREFSTTDKLISEEVTETTSGSFESTSVHSSFDDSGNLLCKKHTQMRGDAIEEEYSIVCDLEYDDKGNLTSVMQERSDTGDVSFTVREYDDSNRVIKEQTKGNNGDYDVISNYEYGYDDYDNSTYEHYSNTINGVSQAEYTYKYITMYNDSNLILCKVQEEGNGDGFYYAYDDEGRLVESIQVIDGSVASNDVNVYNDAGLLLMTFSHPVLHTNDSRYDKIITYEYENSLTDEKVSGEVYDRDKYYGGFSVDHPSPTTTLIDYRALFEQATGVPAGSVKSDMESAKQQLAFDSSINTDPSKVGLASFVQSSSINTEYYVLTLPDYWEGRVSYNVVGPNVDVYLARHREIPILSVSLDGYAIRGDSYYFAISKELPNGKYLNCVFPCWDYAYAKCSSELDSLLFGFPVSQRGAAIEALIDIASGGNTSPEHAVEACSDISMEIDIPSYNFIYSSINISEH